MTEGEMKGGQKKKGGEDRGKELWDEAAWRTILVSGVVVGEGWVFEKKEAIYGAYHSSAH